MFDFDRWQEIFDSIRKNKLRTFLTGLSVASGIFILVVLLAFGNGMRNGIQHEFEADATNRIWIWTSQTSKEYKGLNPGRFVRVDQTDYDYIDTRYAKQLDSKSRLIRVRGSITYKGESGSYSIQGVDPGYQWIESMEMIDGRYINQADIDSMAKVIVISSKIKREMMSDVKHPVGDFFKINNLYFKIVGVYRDKGGEREENRVFIPITTARIISKNTLKINNMGFTLKPAATFDESLAESEKFTKEVETYLKERHKVAPDDQRGIVVFNTLKEAKRYFTLTDNIELFFWIVGIFTIIAGVVGVSNIMLIVVKERTREIGIRKALGEKPWSIIAMVLQESVFITAISGFGGLIVSMALLEVVGPNIEVDYILNPSVDFSMAMTMVILLILAGAIAGFFPAWRAATIRPIEALRDE